MAKTLDRDGLAAMVLRVCPISEKLLRCLLGDELGPGELEPLIAFMQARGEVRKVRCPLTGRDMISNIPRRSEAAALAYEKAQREAGGGKVVRLLPTAKVARSDRGSCREAA